MTHDLVVLPGPYAVCRLHPSDPVPAWAASGDFHAILRTPEELSLVCRQDDVPPDIQAERDWRVLKVAGPLDFALTGVVSGLTAPLAEARITVFVLSTFNTDYILVRADALGRACAVLVENGHRVQARAE